MKKNFIIYGASYPDIIKVLEKKHILSEKQFEARFVDDIKFNLEKSFMGFPIVGDSSYLAKLASNTVVFNNVHSTPKARYLVSKKIEAQGLFVSKLIHPLNDVNYCDIGIGVFMHSCSIGANVKIGNHVCIKINSIINHDNILEDFCFIGPGVTLCGHVTVGRGAYIGAGSVVKDNVVVGEGAIVGAGALVISDVEPWSLVVGTPAKIVKKVEFFDFVANYDCL